MLHIALLFYVYIMCMVNRYDVLWTVVLIYVIDGYDILRISYVHDIKSYYIMLCSYLFKM